jgi:hypothetical protein
MESGTYGRVTNWNEVIKKEVRGLDDADLGEVQEVNQTIIVTEKGSLSKESCIFPSPFNMDIMVAFCFLI